MFAIILSQEQAREIASDWIRAWNARDLEGILAHYADDIYFSSPTVITRLGEPSGVLAGKQRLREHFAKGLETFGATVSFELLDVLTGVNGYTVYYRRENGATVVDTVMVNGQGKAVQVHAHYALPQ
jgi:ketosteroid isomerase-like protein